MKLILLILGKILFFLESTKSKLITLHLQSKYTRKAKKIGKCVKFNGVCIIAHVENIEIGNNVHIGDNAYISGEGGLYIGDNTHISRNLVLYTDSHNYNGNLLPYDNSNILKNVIIEKNVWIGTNVTILPGSHIKEGAIIGAGTVIVGIVEKLAIYGAAQGKVIKYRDKKHYNLLNNSKKYGGPNGNHLHHKCSKEENQ